MLLMEIVIISKLCDRMFIGVLKVGLRVHSRLEYLGESRNE
jgi:hypothetical protein